MKTSGLTLREKALARFRYRRDIIRSKMIELAGWCPECRRRGWHKFGCIRNRGTT